ncbi:unnamed protein product [Xylocopa violacea]|uniref:Uncharacterized protein n=1 Tax=Xylocopa violacea TaxID=135666 RepID=A0ABP1NT67_XYLVO
MGVLRIMQEKGGWAGRKMFSLLNREYSSPWHTYAHDQIQISSISLSNRVPTCPVTVYRVVLNKRVNGELAIKRLVHLPVCQALPAIQRDDRIRSRRKH